MSLNVILPVHNRINITKNLIELLKHQTYQDFQIILVDDGSTDGTSEMVQSYFVNTVILKGNGKLWWGGSLHFAYKWIIGQSKRRPYTLILNDDSVFKEDYLQNGMKLLRENQGRFFIGYVYDVSRPEIEIEWGVKVDWKRFLFENTSNSQDINCLSTRGLFMSTDDFIRVGGFYPTLLPHYLSDYEFTNRAQRKGIVLELHPLLKLWANTTTTGFHEINHDLTFVAFIKKYFSKKAPSNPIYFTSFALLSSPVKYKCLNILRIWEIATKIIIKRFLLSLKKNLFP